MDVRNPRLVTLRVDSLEAALDAWHVKLGIPIKLRGAGWAELQTDTFCLTLVEGTDGPDVIVGFEVESVERAAAHLAAKGLARGDGAIDGAGTRARFSMPGGVALEIVGG